MTNQPVLIGVFDDRYQAEQAVRDLQAANFKHEHIGMVLRGSDASQGGMITDTEGAKDARGAVVGAATGAVTGGILGALATILIPGVGPVLAMGILTTALGGAAAGTAVGGILGAMTGLGISEEEAKYYEQEFHAGKAIVAVRAEDHFDQAEQILRRHGAYNMRFTQHSDVPTEGILNHP